MPKSVQTAKPPLKFIPQHLNPLAIYLVHGLLPLLLRLRLRPWLPSGISHIEVLHAERLANLYHQFQAGKIRFLMAFRHSEVDDPLCMTYLLSRGVPRAARRQGIRLQLPLHSYFIYDRGMTLWAGNWLGWLFSRLGGIPIHRGKRIDRTGIQAARELFMNGHLPLAVAPEGATNGHSERVSPLEPGVAQLGVWCVEGLRKADRPETVWVVPIGIQYCYPNPPWRALNRLLNQLEAESGLPVQSIHPIPAQQPEAMFYPRLLRLADHLLTQMEEFYRRCYRYPFPQIPTTAAESSPNQLLATRLQHVLEAALQIAEQHFGLPSQGTVIERCRRIEEAGWNDIYREDLPDLHHLSSFQRGLADWTAEEAALRMRHMRLVESFVAVTDDYVQACPTAERFAEMLLLCFDLVARIQGKPMPRRPRLGWRQARVTVGEPICVNDRYPNDSRDRLAAKTAVVDLTHELQIALESMVIPSASCGTVSTVSSTE